KFVLEERAIPNVKAGWTLVKIKGFGINHSEIVTRKGLSPTVQFPRILGIECVGQVVETTRRDLQAAFLFPAACHIAGFLPYLKRGFSYLVSKLLLYRV
ncbi:hypothetical protein Q604_UNBC17355G0001, partial [human gut metagenome]